MASEAIGVRFNTAGKIYYFATNDDVFNRGDKIVAETARGVELGTIVMTNKNIEKDASAEPLKQIVRRASGDDIAKEERNRQKAKQAFDIALKKIKQLDLAMKLVDVEFMFDNSKILFYFTADGRVDFRELVKSLASVFKMRVELRQIGVRDQAKMMNGVGICGRGLCCANFLDDFKTVSIKMAKEQGIALNSTKVSGVCGRLMCCLQYEQQTYEEIMQQLPLVGAIVQTADGVGTVKEVSVLTGNIKVKMEPKGEIINVAKPFHASEVMIIKQGETQTERD